MLNNCLTPMGKRKFLYNILNPVCDEEYLQGEYDITEYFLTKLDVYAPFIKNNFSKIKDLAKWSRLVFLKKISPKSFVNLYNNIFIIQKVYENIIQDEKIKAYLMVFEGNILDIGDYCSEIGTFIQQNLNLELAKDLDQIQNFENNFIRIGVDEELDKKTETLKDCELKLDSIQVYLSKLIENKEKKNAKSSDYVKKHETEKNNFSLLCTSRRCKILADALPTTETNVSLYYDEQNINKKYDFKVSKTKFTFDKQSASNNFISDEQISGLCKNISSIKVSMKDLITDVFNKFIVQFEQYQDKLESIINFVTLIDMVYTKSNIALNYNYCKPTIVKSNKSFVNAKQLRHCLIEQFQTNELYVTNDIQLGNGGTDGLLLYGTNAVGKTSFIRALGVAIVMAQSGLYVPCSEFHFMPYKYIFTRIIGNDNIFKGLSTFAVEMSELRTILRLTNENSLILGDELCSGTETHSAISIFVAGIQQLHKCRSSFIFATHLHEIVNYEEITQLDTVKLKHMEVIYDKERQTLIYDRKMKDGPGNSMYGLEVCKSLNLPQDFLDNAYEIRMKYHPESRSILSLKTSQYNSQKVVNLCEKCEKNPGKEVHHLQYQQNANVVGIILSADSVFHKNNLANLMTLCESCHNEIHKKETKLKRVKTTKGTQFKEI